MKVPANPRGARRARIELIPLLDVVFQLLVFFLYLHVSMTFHRGLAVALPEASTSVLDTKDYLALTIRRDGSLAVNKDAVAPGALALALAPWKGKGLEVYVAADRDARHQDVVGALGVLRQEGFERVSIETTLPPAPEGAP